MKKREHGTNIQNNDYNLSSISKRKHFDNEKTDANLLFVYPFPYKYDIEDKVTNTFNELHDKTCSLNNNNIIWAGSIVIDDIKSSRRIINMGREYIILSITKKKNNDQFLKLVLIYLWTISLMIV